MPRGIPASGRARIPSFSVYMRPFIRETLEKRMSVEEGMKFLDEKSKEYKKIWGPLNKKLKK